MEPETALIQQIVFRHLSKQDIFCIAGCCKIPCMVNEQEKLLHRGSPGVNVCCPNFPHTGPCCGLPSVFQQPVPYSQSQCGSWVAEQLPALASALHHFCLRGRRTNVEYRDGFLLTAVSWHLAASVLANPATEMGNGKCLRWLRSALPWKMW